MGFTHVYGGGDSYALQDQAGLCNQFSQLDYHIHHNVPNTVRISHVNQGCALLLDFLYQVELGQ